MFGQKKDDQPSEQQANSAAADDTAQAVVSPDDPAEETAQPPTEDPSWQHPGTPLEDKTEPAAPPEPAPEEEAKPEPISDVVAPAGDNGSPAPITVSAPAEEDLADVRRQALGDLSPLIDHLEHQTPEEKFQVTMMMIQANDDQSLVKTAYEAAQGISDEKVRAQALLEIIQEINYFTQHQPGAK